MVSVAVVLGVDGIVVERHQGRVLRGLNFARGRGIRERW